MRERFASSSLSPGRRLVLLVIVVGGGGGVDLTAPVGDALDEGGEGEEALQHGVEVTRVAWNAFGSAGNTSIRRS